MICKTNYQWELFIFQVRDQNIVAMCKEMGIAVTHEHSHTLYNLDKYYLKRKDHHHHFDNCHHTITIRIIEINAVGSSKSTT